MTSPPAPPASALAPAPVPIVALAAPGPRPTKPLPLVPLLSTDQYVEIPFKKDPWSFYRSLVRGYLLLYSDPDADPSTMDISKTSKIGRILHVGTSHDIRNMFNVFTFDDIVITECDMLFGMLSRISTWAKDKLNAKIPSIENVESGGDYYMEQLKDFFLQKDAHIGTDSVDFLKKLTKIKLKLTIRNGGGRQTSSRATRKKYSQSGGSLKTRFIKAKTRATEEMKTRITKAKTQFKEMKARADIWKNNDGEEKIWNANVREYIRKSSTDPLGGDERSKTFMTQIKKINVVPSETPDDDKDKSKKGKVDDDGLSIEISTMTIEDYFKKISVPVKRKNTTSYSEIVPEVWGHPLLVLIPFARAMQCDIALYEKEKEKDGDGSFKLRAHIKHKADDEMTTVFKMNPKEFTIHILDNNTDETAYHENVLEYMSNFALIVPKSQYDNSLIGLDKKELEIINEEHAKKKSIERERDTKKRISDNAQLKEITDQLKTIKNDLFNLSSTHPAYARLDDENLKANVSRILAGHEVEDKPGTSGILSKKEDGDESSKPKDESKQTIWWNYSYDNIIQSAKNFKQTLRNKIRQNISKPRLILRLKDLISKEETLSAKKEQLTLEKSEIVADV